MLTRERVLAPRGNGGQWGPCRKPQGGLYGLWMRKPMPGAEIASYLWHRTNHIWKTSCVSDQLRNQKLDPEPSPEIDQEIFYAVYSSRFSRIVQPTLDHMWSTHNHSRPRYTQLILQLISKQRAPGRLGEMTRSTLGVQLIERQRTSKFQERGW